MQSKVITNYLKCMPGMLLLEFCQTVMFHCREISQVAKESSYRRSSESGDSDMLVLHDTAAFKYICKSRHKRISGLLLGWLGSSMHGMVVTVDRATRAKNFYHDQPCSISNLITYSRCVLYGILQNCSE